MYINIKLMYTLGKWNYEGFHLFYILEQSLILKRLDDLHNLKNKDFFQLRMNGFIDMYL